MFPSFRSRKRPTSDNTLNAALRRLGYAQEDMTAHGFRAMARTAIAEALHVDPFIIEAAGDHETRAPGHWTAPIRIAPMRSSMSVTSACGSGA